MTTAYHLQADGQTERTNQILGQYLRCYVNSYRKDNWSQMLPTAEFAYNNIASELTKFSPFYMELGRHPLAGPSNIQPSANTDLNQIARDRWNAQEQAKATLQLAAE